MMKSTKQPLKGQRRLFLPMQPTPNGGLHLGHMSGPFLQSDIIARRLRQLGADVAVMCGADVYENWVLLPAHDANIAPEKMCEANANQIFSDLEYFGVEMDYWASPFSSVDQDGYHEVHNRLLAEAKAAERLTLRTERVPYSQKMDGPVYGVWLQGVCPGCNEPAGGNACENCGHHYQPDEILSPHSRDGDTELEWREEKAWYTQAISSASLAAELKNVVPQAEFRELAESYAAKAEARTRITSPDTWGIPNSTDQHGKTICNTFYGFCLYLASVYGEHRSVPNPLLDSSTTTQVTVFAGIDNLAAALVGPVNISLAIPRARNFDQVLLSKFLLFEGRKFSTSRQHGIWLLDLARLDDIHPDELRLYLATILPSDTETDFDPITCSHFIERHRAALRDRLRLISRVMEIPVAMHEHMETNPGRLASDYLEFLCQPVSSAEVWLSRFSYLATPLMPRLAAMIISNFGPAGDGQIPKPLCGSLEPDTLSLVAHRESDPQPLNS